MLRHLSAIFLQGLVATLPLIITVWLLGLLVWSAEVTVRGVLQALLPPWLFEALYMPGTGVAATVLLIFIIGLLLNAYVVKRIYDLAERLMQRIPVVKSIYWAVKDFLQYFAGAQQQQMNQVVLVRFPGSNYKLLGLVTRQRFDDLPEGLGDSDSVAVYTPMSYQIGGYTLILPRDQVEPIDMSIEDALRFSLTAGVTVHEPMHTPPPTAARAQNPDPAPDAEATTTPPEQPDSQTADAPEQR